MFLFKVGFLLMLPLVIADLAQEPLASDHDDYAPTEESARANSNLIFNSIHAAMRQWGSSVQHNGLSLFMATVPEGTLLYHGTPYSEPVTGMEWLAFEIEHSELFARGMPVQLFSQQPRSPPGYLHVYRSNRPLRLLYFDGMSAADGDNGPCDTQDLVFLGIHKDNSSLQFSRAKELCQKGAQWGIEGFVRMEAGFEIIKCNFSDGLDIVALNQRQPDDGIEGLNEWYSLEYMRSVQNQFEKIGSHRVIVDFSSMIHAGFYPQTNFTNIDSRLDRGLPRLRASDAHQLARMSSDFKQVWDNNASVHNVDWQGVTDLITNRYFDRLQLMSTTPDPVLFMSLINQLTNTHIDYKSYSLETSILACMSHFLLPAQVHTAQDKLIYAAIEEVSSRICTTLMMVREDMKSKNWDCDTEWKAGRHCRPVGEIRYEKSLQMIRSLIDYLAWPETKLCRPSCPYNEVCFIAVFPWGRESDHYNPSCVNNTDIMNHVGLTQSYFFPQGHFEENSYIVYNEGKGEKIWSECRLTEGGHAVCGDGRSKERTVH